MYWKPQQTANNPANPFWHPLNKKTQPIDEAVTVELDFKSDAEGKKAGGKMVRKGVYKMTFKNNAEMNKFMDTHADKLNEGINEGTPAYRKMMKRYKGSDNEKVFKMLRAKGYKVGEQDDTLVSNLLKRHRGNVKKVVDQIVKDYPGKFDVERMMMDHVEIDEASVYKRPAKVSALGGQKFHAIVQDGKIVAAGMTEKEARKTKKFGQQVRELPGAKVGQLVKENVKVNDIDEYVNLHEESMAQGEQDFSWDSITELIQYFMQAGNPNQGQLLALDFNRDGVIDFTDLTIALSLWSQGLPPMFADSYNTYMASDARSGVKQQAGSQIQLGQRPGDLAARPPQAPSNPDMSGGAGGR
jgi:hypothetical protein